MPGMDGFEVCQQLKAAPDTRDSAVIFLTARDDKGDRLAGLELGAIDYIQKPFDADELLVRVKSHVEGYQRQIALAPESGITPKDEQPFSPA